jgi:hypothetical protein
MEIYPVGLIVVAIGTLAGILSRYAAMIALVMSIAFGSLAVASGPGFGNLLVTQVMLIIFTLRALRSAGSLNRLLNVVFATRSGLAMLFLIMYAVFGAIIIPRLFAGSVTVLEVDRVSKSVVLMPLRPSSTNMTQSFYLAGNVALFFLLRLELQSMRALKAAAVAVEALIVSNLVLATVDLTSKTVGLGDTLEFLRTAKYAYHAEEEVAGFFRIVGAFPETSTFSYVTFGLFAFAYCYWRSSRQAKWFVYSCAMLFYLVLSTSSTAYVSMGVGFMVLIGLLVLEVSRGQISKPLLLSIGLMWVGMTGVILIVLFDPDRLKPLMTLFEQMVLNKAQSSSARERFFWNQVSWQAFVDTWGLGVGLGSSRASSWLVAVLSQLGVVGIALFSLLIWLAIQPGPKSSPIGSEGRATINALAAGSRGALIACMTSASISGALVDLGALFYFALAILTCSAYRHPQSVFADPRIRRAASPRTRPIPTWVGTPDFARRSSR